MSIIFITISILCLIKIVRDSLFFAWLWQIKEYRIDRMISYLKSKDRILKNNLFYFVIFILFISSFIFIKNNSFSLQFLILIVLSGVFLQIIKEIKNKSLKRPKLTFKIILILGLILIFYTLSFLNLMLLRHNLKITSFFNVYLLFACLFTPILVTLVVLSVNPFFSFQKRKIIEKASLKMKQFKKVKVIGITGSYGKTSTKEFLYTILSKKYQVIKTEGNNNTNIGVAYTVLNKMDDKYDYFICEMGAYKIGEIAEMCKIVNPKFGILTGINEQHLELFKSIKNTKKAKFELIESLPENGLAVINSNIENKTFKTKTATEYFSLKNIKNIKVHQDCIEFIYKNYEFQINLIGKHYLENIISAIIISEHLGMNLKEISQAVCEIKPNKYMIRKLDGLNNSIFIDDSYSANPDGVVAALDYLNDTYQDYEKIIVFPGIIELGKESNRIHKKIFNRINEVCDKAYLMNNKFKYIYKKNKNRDCKFIFEENFDQVTNELRNNLKSKTVVLFESRGAGVVMKKIN